MQHRWISTVICICAMAIITASSSTRANAARRTITVVADRIVLADLVPNVSAELGAIDLGASPAPGAKRVLRRAEMKRRIEAAMAGPVAIRLPARVTVKRAFQRVTEANLRDIIKNAIKPILPDSAQIRRMFLAGGRLLPVGQISVSLPPTLQFRAGRQTFRVFLAVGDGMPMSVPVTLDIAKVAIHRDIVVERGKRVWVEARGRGLLARVRGVAQESGSRGERIGVIPSGAQRVVHARVHDAQTVQVDP